jgi:flagellar biosynthesis/type III secretory pathway protein FliH
MPPGPRHLASAAVERVTEEILESATIDRLLMQVIESGALERWAAALLEDEEAIERTVARILDSHIVAAAVKQLGESEAFQQVISSAARSPEVLDALHAQSATLANELAAETRSRTARVDDALEAAARRLVHRRRRTQPTIGIAVGVRLDA